jgi:hypothetical protein
MSPAAALTRVIAARSVAGDIALSMDVVRQREVPISGAVASKREC